ncbi:MAG: YraN family protein [Halieaceae bacterium]
MNKGQVYEDQAAQMLLGAGLEILERNYRCKLGEIDLICSDGKALVFVEVRFRRQQHYASAAASVTHAKQRRLWRTAQLYLQRRGWSDKRPCRFDVIAISAGQPGQEDGIQWLKNAITM